MTTLPYTIPPDVFARNPKAVTVERWTMSRIEDAARTVAIDHVAD